MTSRAHSTETTPVSIRLPKEDLDVLARAVRQVRADDRDLSSAQPSDFQDLSRCPCVGLIRAALAREGVVKVSGFPVDDERVELGFWGYCTGLGDPLPQNRNLSRVDVVANVDPRSVRGAKTNRALAFHTDMANTTPDVFALLTVRQATAGGASKLARIADLTDALMSQPEVYVTLRQPFMFDRSGDVSDGVEPVFESPIVSVRQGVPSVVYNRARIHRGHRLVGQPLTAAQQAALDALDELLATSDAVHRFTLQSGDVLFVDNRAVLHAREEFEDTAPQGRHLLRVWLQARNELREGRREVASR
ncbi:TauD/TfdA family dioxygenase [Kribbella sancticallisti]|uniref:TauD/TfdA family dioxygenase n=1 Tax=Kribbella sancticallisti TaxID=460087 RepID=A0ABN2ET20_9ACTN